ncbi:MAG: PEP-utilizing enzyme [Patescibacteria group bacterium]|nr:PEP-utilizing enzyme [Patescibacteria group bacterium]
MRQKIKKWELYLARPFTLFGASLWREWYYSKLYLHTVGANFKNCLMIEHPKGVVRYYRRRDEQAKFYRALNNLVLKNKNKLEKLLKRGLVLNTKAVREIKKNNFKDFKSAVDFMIELSLLCTVLPFKSGDALTNSTKDKRIFALVRKLRMVSYYERVINKIIVPLALKERESLGLKNREEINFVTLNEILQKKRVNLSKRVSESKKGKFFVYRNFNGAERISWVKDPGKIISKIEGASKLTDIVRGNSAYGGFAKGTVRLVLTNEIKSIVFNEGDILVATSTSPELMALIKKCGAIITDEGGITCHAAIIARELKKPCVIGTKIATKVLHDGDLVEVDADRGVVKIIK